jgi:hypothetical protein
MGGLTGIPTGSVEFCDGSTDLGPGYDCGGGVWTLSTSSTAWEAGALSIGSNTITAVYSGDSNLPGGQ